MPKASSIRNGSSRRCSGCVSTRVSLTPAPSEVGWPATRRSTVARHAPRLRAGVRQSSSSSSAPLAARPRRGRCWNGAGHRVIKRPALPRSAACAEAIAFASRAPAPIARPSAYTNWTSVMPRKREHGPQVGHLGVRRRVAVLAAARQRHVDLLALEQALGTRSPCSGTSRRRATIASIQFLSCAGTPKLYIGTPSTTTSAA